MLTALALVIHFEGGSCVGVQRRNKSSHNVGLVCVILSDSRDPRGGERQRTLPTSVHEGFSVATQTPAWSDQDKPRVTHLMDWFHGRVTLRLRHTQFDDRAWKEGLRGSQTSVSLILEKTRGSHGGLQWRRATSQWPEAPLGPETHLPNLP